MGGASQAGGLLAAQGAGTGPWAQPALPTPFLPLTVRGAGGVASPACAPWPGPSCGGAASGRAAGPAGDWGRDWSPARVSSSWSRPGCPLLFRAHHRAWPPRDPPAQGSPGLLATPDGSGSGEHSSSFLEPPCDPPCEPPAERQALCPGVITEEIAGPPGGPQALLGSVGGEPGLGVTVE